jgi:putative flippase GtrA
MTHYRTMTRLGAFNVVGVLGLGVQAALLWLLMAVGGFNYLLATALAVEGAILHNFFWHERWTWSDRTRPNPSGWMGRLARFNLTTGAVSIAGNLAAMAALVGGLRLHYLAATLIAVAACSVLNFMATDRLVFRLSILANARLAAPAVQRAIASQRQGADWSHELRRGFDTGTVCEHSSGECFRHLSECGIRPEDLKVERHFLKVSQGMGAFPAANVAVQIDVEEILPWVAVDRARLNLGQVDIAQRKNGQGLEQRARFVFQTKDQCSLSPAPLEPAAAGQREEPGIVLPVIFYALPQHLHAVDARCAFGGDGGSSF